MKEIVIHRAVITTVFLVIVVSSLILNPVIASSDSCPPADQCWTTQDVIDTRIDSHAQTALMGMLTRGGAEANDASSLLCAVKQRQIEGIYLPDQQVPALRARGAGSNWWDMITHGNSECYTPEPPNYRKKPPGRQVWPVIVFRKQIKGQSKQLALALSDAWQACLKKALPRIQPLGEKCYVATISKLRRPPPGKGLLTVSIYNSNNGHGLQGASITIRGGGVGMTKSTSSGGAVEFGPLEPATYEVRIGTAPGSGCKRSYSDRAPVNVSISADEHEWVSRGIDCGQ